jgi:seryl-tRNA synthetase
MPAIDIQRQLSSEEHKELMELSNEIAALINPKIARLIKDKKLKELKKFVVSIAGIAFKFDADEKTMKEVLERGQNITYVG